MGLRVAKKHEIRDGCAHRDLSPPYDCNSRIKLQLLDYKITIGKTIKAIFHFPVDTNQLLVEQQDSFLCS